MLVRSLLCFSWILSVYAVNRPPNIYIQPKIWDIYYKEGESVELPCVANGIPKPTYKWKRNGIDYNPSGQDDRVVQLPNQGTIVFNKPEDKDEGIFQCFADNGYGTSASVKINFRQAKLGTFVYADTLSHGVYAGESLVLPCTPPVSFPPADFYWVVKESNGRWSAINFNKRVNPDIEGKLRFTNVRKSDEQGGKAYACMAINYFMRDNAIGPEHTIKVYGNTEQKRPATLFWSSPTDQFFLKGGLLRLMCNFAGNPTPDVYWEKVNGQLPDRAKYKSFGQLLEITNVQMSDAGEYECMGINSESTQRAYVSFSVRVERKPDWVEDGEPRDREAGVGEKATFICQADGIPKPTYKWYINGVRLSEVKDPRIHNNNRFIQPNMNNITLTNLTLEDHMNIQCNATNKHGYVFSDVYLNVLAEKPTIVTPPQPHLKVAEGQSVNISCKVTGKPDPIVTWYRDTTLITGGRFKIAPNGDLHILNVVMADAGDYRCQASNIYERDVTSSICKMEIRRKTRIEQYPMDLEVIAGFDAKFTCSGSTDFDEAKNMRVYWEKDDKQVSTSEQRMTQNFQDNSLTISGTIIRDSGVYTCIITNGLDEDRSYAILTVKDKPDPPSGVAVERCRFKSAELKWIKGMENNAPIQYFIVQYNTTFNADQWVSAKTVSYTKNTAIIDLEPWANYTFRILAMNKVGASLPSTHTTKVCKTDPAQPYKNPRNLRAIGDRRGYLVLEWIPMNQLEHNGPGFRYQLTVKERGTTDLKTYNIDKWYNNTIAIPVTGKVFTPYLVRLQAKNNKGDSEEDPDELTLYSYEDIPSAMASNVQVTDIKDTTATIAFTWDTLWLEEKDMMSKIRGELKGFKIQYWRSGEKMSTFREEFVMVSDVIPRKDLPGGRKKRAATQATYVMQNLSPYSNMLVQVAVMNNYYVGQPTDPINFQTYEGVPGPVMNFEARIISSNSITLVWTPPDLEDRNGILEGYDIGYQFVNGLELGAFHDRDEQINNPLSTSDVLSGLLPSRKYRVHIYARTRNGRGEGTFIEVTTTAKVNLGVPLFNIPYVGEHSINVTWSRGAHVGTRVVHYVEFRKEGAADWQQSADEVIHNYKEIPNLERGTYYEVRVVAFDGVNRAASETKVVGTVGFAAARALAANYGWFIGMILAGVALIAVIIFVYFIHRKRKDIEEKPRSTPGAVLGRENAPMKGYDDYDRDSRGQYNDYHRGERKRYRNDNEDSDDDDRRDSYDRGGAGGYSNHDYDEKHGGYHDDRDYDRDRDYDKDRDYDRDYDKDRDYDRDYDKDRDYDRDYDRDSYNRDSYRDSYRDDDRRYDDYDRDRDPPQYDRAPSYERSDSMEKRRLSDDGDKYEDYQREPSKFDEDGNPKPSGTTTPSTFV